VSGPLLTANELAVLRRAADGQTYAVIARELGYAEKSVSKMALRLARKLGANNITHAVLLACRAGILNGRPRQERHGDHPGYTAHQKRGEDACDACKAGESRYQVERRQRRRQEGVGGAVAALEAVSGAPPDVPGAARAAEEAA
jgi:DNA-binding CsgD family transcriptional regulator